MLYICSRDSTLIFHSVRVASENSYLRGFFLSQISIFKFIVQGKLFLTANGSPLTAHGSRLTAYRLPLSGCQQTVYGQRLTVVRCRLSVSGLRLAVVR